MHLHPFRLETNKECREEEELYTEEEGELVPEADYALVVPLRPD